MSLAQRFERRAPIAGRGRKASRATARVLPFCTSRGAHAATGANGLVRAQVCLIPVTNHAYIQSHSLSSRAAERDFPGEVQAVPAVTAARSDDGKGNRVARPAAFQISGAMRGNCIGHRPEAATCGPIALLRDGDVITLERQTPSGAGVASEEFERRKRDWAPRETQIGSGVDWMFAQQARVAHEAAPACGKGAKECHADFWG